VADPRQAVHSVMILVDKYTQQPEHGAHILVTPFGSANIFKVSAPAVRRPACSGRPAPVGLRRSGLLRRLAAAVHARAR
jgi:hypothetical protein